MSVEKRLRELGYTLPEPPTPKGVYVTALEVDGMLYTSGSTCFEAGGLKYQGTIGADLVVEEGYDACKFTMLNLLGVNELPMDSPVGIELIVKLKD